MIIRLIPITLFAMLLTALTVNADDSIRTCSGNGAVFQFEVRGKSAKLSAAGDSDEYRVIRTFSADKQTLSEASRYIREKAVSGTGYTLRSHEGDEALWVVKGESGDRYLLAVGLGIHLLGSEKNCR